MEERTRDLEIRTCKNCAGMYIAKVNDADQGVCPECFKKMIYDYNKGNGYKKHYHQTSYRKDNYNSSRRFNNRRKFEPLLDENGERVYKTFFMQLNKEEREFLEMLSKGLHETKKKIVFDALRLYSETDEVKEKMGANKEEL